MSCGEREISLAMIPRTPSEKDRIWNIIFSQTISFLRETPLAWFFGCILSLPILLVIFLESISTDIGDVDFLLIAPKVMGSLFACAIVFFASEAGIILSFKKTSSSPIEYLAATGALMRWYFLILLLVLGFFAFFFAPLSFIPDASRSLVQYISLYFFLLIAGALFILKMFGGFYLLLSKLSLSAAFRSAADILMDHLSRSVILLIVTSVFSLLIGIIIEALHTFLRFPFSDALTGNTTLLLVIFSLATFSHVFFRALWYFFFQFIATEKPKGWQEPKKMVKESMVPAEDEA